MPRIALTPPLDIRVSVGPFKNSRLYRESGKEEARRFISLCNVQPHDTVLDIGCGCGRIAAELTAYLRPAGVERYVAEVARVLKPGGRFLVSHLLLNAEALRAIEAGTTIFNFRYELGPCRTFDPQTPEEGVAYEEGYVRALFERNGLYVQEPIHYGTWRHKRSYIITHDWVVVRKG